MALSSTTTKIPTTTPTAETTAKRKRRRRQREKLDKNAKIVIVGSGLGGLGAAISLEQAGFTNVLVVERDLSAQQQRKGYGLTLGYNPKGPLARMNVLERVAEKDCPSRSHYMFNPKGNVLSYYGNAFSPPNRGLGQRGNLRVPRQVLRQILMNQLKLSSISFGRRVVGLEPEECGEADDENDNDNHRSPLLAVRFDDGTAERNVELVVAADGIRSAVVKSLLPDDDRGLRCLGVFIILGIATFAHPLLDERGFYTLSGRERLFTMPYAGSRFDGTQHRQVMWQLSFCTDSAESLRRLDSSGLRELVLTKCRNWHEPVVDMVQATPLETVWGTSLMDRDPQELIHSLRAVPLSSRVVVVGDAAHSMSPFKGQGANQALMDGPLLAAWLEKASWSAAIKGYMREMAQRTSPKVRQSREAAVHLHSSGVFASHDFAGVASERVADVLTALRQRKVGAWDCQHLDDRISRVLRDMGLGSPCTARGMRSSATTETKADHQQKEQQRLALSLAAKGDTPGLRNLSLACSEHIQTARDDRGRSCLHLSAGGGHANTCRWLVSEAFMDCHEEDIDGKTAQEWAKISKHEETIQLLTNWAKTSNNSPVKTLLL